MFGHHVAATCSGKMFGEDDGATMMGEDGGSHITIVISPLIGSMLRHHVAPHNPYPPDLIPPWLPSELARKWLAANAPVLNNGHSFAVALSPPRSARCDRLRRRWPLPPVAAPASGKRGLMIGAVGI